MPIKNIVSLLFELTIFLLLVIQLHELVKTYVLPMLREQIKLIKKKLKDLADKRELAVATKKHLQEKIKDQEKSLLTLEEKIENWHAARVQKETASKKHQAELNTALQSKKKKQFYNLELTKSQKMILPKAIREAAKKLIEKYEGEKGKKLLKNVLDQLGKTK